MRDPQPGVRQQHGARLAGLLSQSWREHPSPTQISHDELDSIRLLVLGSGAAGLAWRRLRESALAGTPAVRELQDGYRLHVLRTARLEGTLVRAAKLLNAVGIQPVVVKGWAIARLYPEKGLRPYGDLDLCVPPAQYGAARAALPEEEFRGVVDLHNGFHNGYHAFDRRRSTEMAARSLLVTFGDAEVRVLTPEDHFRLLSFHFLRHGACRPLWLCDIALALESRPADFDWDYCLGKVRHEANWLACTIGLAGRLLGARIDDTPVADRARRLPQWLVPTVLKAWGALPEVYRYPMGLFLANPIAFLREIPHRLVNPLEATINLNAPLNSVPRLPLQLANTVWRAARSSLKLRAHLDAQRAARAVASEDL